MHMIRRLRFPNSGIRAKAARTRGSQPRPTPHGWLACHGQPLCRVDHKRLGRPQGPVGCSRGPPVRGRSATARPPARGGHPQGQKPASGKPDAGTTPAGRLPVGRSTARYQQPARKGLLACGEAAGAALTRSLPVEGRRPQRRHLRAQRQLPTGKGNRRLRRGSDGSGAEGEYGLGILWRKG
ncbi:hypothetical protein BHE74_00046781 [Ensete ventricosum]|nr:hypothetical protein BHE74_00046781 [Ensete ventricosum]RZS12544.1 hypothetical protein BHM03_00044007 [Ensete ventricosum]